MTETCYTFRFEINNYFEPETMNYFYESLKKNLETNTAFLGEDLIYKKNSLNREEFIGKETLEKHSKIKSLKETKKRSTFSSTPSKKNNENLERGLQDLKQKLDDLLEIREASEDEMTYKRPLNVFKKNLTIYANYLRKENCNSGTPSHCFLQNWQFPKNDDISQIIEETSFVEEKINELQNINEIQSVNYDVSDPCNKLTSIWNNLFRQSFSIQLENEIQERAKYSSVIWQQISQTDSSVLTNLETTAMKNGIVELRKLFAKKTSSQPIFVAIDEGNRCFAAWNPNNEEKGIITLPYSLALPLEGILPLQLSRLSPVFQEQLESYRDAAIEQFFEIYNEITEN